MLKEALEAGSRLRGPEHYLTLWTLWKLAELDRDRGRFDRADAEFRRCIEGFLKLQGPEGTDVATMRADLALNELRRGEPARAEPLFREALRVYDRAKPDDWRRFEIQGQLGESLAARKRFAEAEPLIIGGYEGLTARRKDVTADAWRRLPEAGRRVVRLYEAWGKPAEADRWRKKIPPEDGRDAQPEAPAAPGPTGRSAIGGAPPAAGLLITRALRLFPLHHVRWLRTTGVLA